MTVDCSTRTLACFVKPGDITSDGWTIQFVSYEYTDDAIVRVWTHEYFKRPRSILDRHRRWGPIDGIPVQ